jgi:hypothetical protein
LPCCLHSSSAGSRPRSFRARVCVCVCKGKVRWWGVIMVDHIRGATLCMWACGHVGMGARGHCAAVIALAVHAGVAACGFVRRCRCVSRGNTPTAIAASAIPPPPPLCSCPARLRPHAARARPTQPQLSQRTIVHAGTAHTRTTHAPPCTRTAPSMNPHARVRVHMRTRPLRTSRMWRSSSAVMGTERSGAGSAGVGAFHALLEGGSALWRGASHMCVCVCVCVERGFRTQCAPCCARIA